MTFEQIRRDNQYAWGAMLTRLEQASRNTRHHGAYLRLWTAARDAQHAAIRESVARLGAEASAAVAAAWNEPWSRLRTKELPTWR